MDVYAEVAKRCKVERAEVKALAFPILYCMGSPKTESELLEALVVQVETAIQMGLVKKQEGGAPPAS